MLYMFFGLPAFSIHIVASITSHEIYPESLRRALHHTAITFVHSGLQNREGSLNKFQMRYSLTHSGTQ